jgi:hypothetical protein
MPRTQVCRSRCSGGDERGGREIRFDTVLYFSFEEEMVSLFELLFVVIELKPIDIAGKFRAHKAIYAFLTKQ